MNYKKNLHQHIASVIIIGLLVILATGSGDSDEGDSTSSSVSGRQTITETYIGCISNQDIKKLTDFAVQKDQAAYSSFLSTRLLNGTCIRLTQGTTVYVMDYDFPGLVKVRKEGETTGYWTYSEAVQ